MEDVVRRLAERQPQQQNIFVVLSLQTSKMILSYSKVGADQKGK